MLISASIIKKPMAKRRCYWCNKEIHGPTLRLFGAAFSCDPPYVVYEHPECCKWDDPKILKAKKQITPPASQPEE